MLPRLLLIILAACLSGCGRHRQTDSFQSAHAVPDVYAMKTIESLRQLLTTQVVNDAPVLPPSHSLRQFGVPDSQALAADGHRYTMLISDDDGLMWLHKTGGIGNHISEFPGPWSVANPSAIALQTAIANTVVEEHDRIEQ